MAKTLKYFVKGIELRGESADISDNLEGSIFHQSTANRLKTYIQAAVREIVTADQSQVLTNKTINASNNTISNINTTHLGAGVLDTDLSTVSGADDTIPSAKAVVSYVASAIALKDQASEISVVPAGGIAAITVQAALEELDTEKITGNAAIVASTKTKITYDTKGLVTAGADATTADIADSLNKRYVTDANLTVIGNTSNTNTGDQTITLTGGVTGSGTGSFAATVVTNANLTGPITSVGNATSVASQTGTGSKFVMDTAPTIATAVMTSPSIQTPSRLDMKKDTLANLQTYASTAADGQLVFATDTLATYVVKSSALAVVGGGGIANYILAPDAESGSSGWATYADAAATSPVDGTGGSPASTFTVSTDTSLRGASNFLFTKSAANRQGEGFSYAFTIDNSDKGKVLNCSMEYLIASGTYVDNDMSFWIYDVTNSRLIQPAPYLIKKSGIIEKFAFEFQTSIDSTSYRLIAHVATALSSPFTIRFDNFNVSAQAKLYGSAVTDWVTDSAFTACAGFGTLANKSVQYKREGDMLHVRGYFTAGTVSAVGLSINLPAGLSIDYTKITTTANVMRVGTINGLKAAAGAVDFFATDREQILYLNGSTTNIVYGSYVSQNGILPAGGTNVSASYTTGDGITFSYSVPILGWSSSQVMSSDADTRVVAAKIGGAAASATANNPIKYPTTLQDTHSAYSAATGLYTVVVPGFYEVKATFSGTLAAASALYVSIDGSTAPSTTGPLLAWQAIANMGIAGSAIVNVNAGQTISIRANANTGAAAAYDSASISRIAGPAQVMSSEICSFSANTSTTAATTSAPFIYTVKDHDTHNAYSTSTGKFTAPMSGKYSFQYNSYTGGITFSANLYKNTAIAFRGIPSAGDVGGGSTTIYLLAGETIEIRPSANVTAGGSAFYNTFSGFRIGL